VAIVGQEKRTEKIALGRFQKAGFAGKRLNPVRTILLK
jgi:hypothetical protein